MINLKPQEIFELVEEEISTKSEKEIKRKSRNVLEISVGNRR